MAHNNVLMFSVFLVIMFLTTVQTERYRQQLRPANEFQDLDLGIDYRIINDLGVTRGSGKHAPGKHNVHNSPPDRELVDKREFQEMDLPVARGFGKRIGNINMDTIKFLQDWNKLKTKLERLQMSQVSSDPSFINEYFLRQQM